MTCGLVCRTPLVMTKAKICGLSTPEALDAALDGGAAYVGAVIFPKSPRYIPPREAGYLFQMARRHARIVAVVVNPDDALLAEIALTLRPHLIQLHGDETIERAAEVRRLTGAGIIKALPIRTEADFATVPDWADLADHLLFDAKVPEGSSLPGGVGASFDWKLMTGRELPPNWFLAGGLDRHNITQAVQVSKAPLVDVSSGVESSPGVKEPELIRAFLKGLAPCSHHEKDCCS